MPYRVRLQITNPAPMPRTVRIPKGTVFEVVSPFSRTQNLATVGHHVVTVPARQTQVVVVDSWCINRSYAPPSHTPMRATPFVYASGGLDQGGVWDDLGRRS